MPPTTLQPTGEPAVHLLDVRAVAAMLDCSPHHVYRLAKAGRMPAPVRLGALVRWPRDSIDAWIAGGCKPLSGRGGGDEP
jgi:excisionase family DNA binding protein